MILNLLAIRWDVDPELFTLGPLTIRWYGLFFMLSFVFGFLIMKRIFLKEGHTVAELDKLSLYIGLGTIIGARLGHCLFYEPAYFLSNPLEILMIHKGGLASHGAAVGILFATWLFARKYPSTRFLWVLDRMVIVIALSGVLIRTGNLMNSEIVGTPSDLPWAFDFVRHYELNPVSRHPSQIYEALCNLLIFGTLFWLYEKRDWGKQKGKLFGLFLVLLFSARFLIEFVKANQESFEEEMFLNMGQLLSLPLIIIGIYLLIRKNSNELLKVG